MLNNCIILILYDTMSENSNKPYSLLGFICKTKYMNYLNMFICMKVNFFQFSTRSYDFYIFICVYRHFFVDTFLYVILSSFSATRCPFCNVFCTFGRAFMCEKSKIETPGNMLCKYLV